MKHAVSKAQRVLYACSNIPAFHIGFLLVSFILAALTNFGASLIFLVAALTVSWVRESRQAARHPGVAAMRRHLPDFLVLLTGLASSVFLSPSSSLVARTGLLRAGYTALRGSAVLTAKTFVLLRFMSTLAWVPEDGTRRITPVEIFFLLSFALVVALLALAPFVVAGGFDGVVQLLRSEIIPWRM